MFLRYVVLQLFCIYNYIPETNRVSTVCSVTAVLYLQLYTRNKPCFYGIQSCSCSVFTICATCNVISPVQYVLRLYISTSRSVCAVHNTAVFGSSLISRFSGMLLRYCLSDFEMVPVAPIITGITFAFTLHVRWISIISYLYFKIFSASVFITFLSP